MSTTQPKPRKRKKYHVLLIPSSDDEKDFDCISNFDDAMKLANKKVGCSVDHRKFATSNERKRFIEGYEAGLGYMGQGLYYTKDI